MARTLQLFVLALVLVPQALFGAGQPVTVASKNFNESYLLAEIMAQRLEAKGFAVERRFGLGGTLICYEALVNGEVDLYAEYTGTLAQAILKRSGPVPALSVLNDAVGPELELLQSFGFNNTYAIAIKEEMANRLSLTKVSQLTSFPDLEMAFSLEFLNREDGWPGLAATYGFTGRPTGIEHGLAYQAIDGGKIDLTDAYSTDGDLARYQLTTLIDDRGYFPEYLAVPFLRRSLPDGVRQALAGLSGRIDDNRMRQLNAEVVINGRDFADVAREFLTQEGLEVTAQSTEGENPSNRMWIQMAGNTLTHLKLTGIALIAGILVGLPLGIVVFRHRTLARMVVYVAGLLQTVPSIALLALMIPLLGIGEKPAIVALFLYSLLPILRSTITALVTIDPLLKRIAEAIGLTRGQQLRHVLVPMALPNILAGIKTAAIISIGTATLAAFIGAGGLGEPIVTGLALSDTNLILQGAIPAAGLAIIVELMFEGIEKVLVREHMLEGRLAG